MAERVPFRGGWTCSCVATSLPLVEEEMLLRGLIKDRIDIFQLGHRGDVKASAGTHDAGGNVDVGQYSDEQIDIWRLWGWTMQNRSPWFPGNAHAHGAPYGCPHIAAGGQYQVTAWDNRRNGLASSGPVQGRWPVKGWKTALRERKPIVMALKDDIAAEVVARLRKEYPAIADEVLKRDVIDNTLTGNPKNKTIGARTALAYIGRRLSGADDRAKRIEDKLDRLLTQKEPS